jgi:hypothetical protein
MAAVASAMAPDYSAFELAWVLGRYFADATPSTVAALTDDQVVIMTAAGLSLFSGIPLLDLLQLGLERPSSLGRLSPPGLDLKLGGGIYPLAMTVYDSSTVAFSLPRELQPFVDQLCSTTQADNRSKQRLIDLRCPKARLSSD